MGTQPTILIIAGSDSGGGAGIQADLKTVSALGAYGMTVITALTAQNSVEVREILPVEAHFVRSQFRACVDDVRPDAVKVGMLYREAVAEVVAEELEQVGLERVVLDPVLGSSTGCSFADEALVASIRTRLLPRATVVTPNLAEAERLVGQPVRSLPQMRAAARRLCELGAAAAVVTGGHLDGEPVDVVYDADQYVELRGERVETPHRHGTGCCFSSALAVGLARGFGVVEAAQLAKRTVLAALRAARAVGHGAGSVDPLAGRAKSL